MMKSKTKRLKDLIKVGDYLPFVVQRGVNETTLPLKKGDVFWTVRLGRDGFLDVEKQAEAEIISRLVRIENLLKKAKR